eukprot:1350947-Pleurochrysis_carterae.AAC.3
MHTTSPSLPLLSLCARKLEHKQERARKNYKTQGIAVIERRSQIQARTDPRSPEDREEKKASILTHAHTRTHSHTQTETQTRTDARSYGKPLLTPPQPHTSARKSLHALTNSSLRACHASCRACCACGDDSQLLLRLDAKDEEIVLREGYEARGRGPGKGKNRESQEDKSARRRAEAMASKWLGRLQLKDSDAYRKQTKLEERRIEGKGKAPRSEPAGSTHFNSRSALEINAESHSDAIGEHRAGG